MSRIRILPRFALSCLLLAFSSLLAGCHGSDEVAPDLACLEGHNLLGAVVTAEQVYYQRNSQYVNVPDWSGFSDTLGLSLGHMDDRWTLQVFGASSRGYSAAVNGRSGTAAEGMSGVLIYSKLGGPTIAWSGHTCDTSAPASSTNRCSEGLAGLSSIETAEQVYYHQHLTYLGVITTAGIEDSLGADVSDPAADWDFSVTAATDTSYLARAVGRPYTEAESRVATLRFTRHSGIFVDCR